jgi:hypothetical protein
MIRRFAYTALILSTMTLLTGCLDAQTRAESMTPENDSYWAGKTCDLTDYNTCGTSLQCTPVIESGDLIDAVCMLRQGHVCNPNSVEMCARGSVCRTLHEGDEDYRCLPNTCIDSSECPEGQACSDNVCVTPTHCVL